jgi:hypothetical protein
LDRVKASMFIAELRRNIFTNPETMNSAPRATPKVEAVGPPRTAAPTRTTAVRSETTANKPFDDRPMMTAPWVPRKDSRRGKPSTPNTSRKVPTAAQLTRSTNAVESINARYRRAIRARGHFPTEQAAIKCLYLVTRSLDPTGKGRARWAMRWKPALNAFAITFEDRITPNVA